MTKLPKLAALALHYDAPLPSGQTHRFDFPALTALEISAPDKFQLPQIRAPKLTSIECDCELAQGALVSLMLAAPALNSVRQARNNRSSVYDRSTFNRASSACKDESAKLNEALANAQLWPELRRFELLQPLSLQLSHLHRLTHLTHLSVRVSDATAIRVVTALLTRLPLLQHATIAAHADVAFSFSADVATAGLVSLPHLRTLAIDFCDENLQRQLSFPALEELTVNGCNQSAPFARARVSLALIVERCPQLMQLSLSRCDADFEPAISSSSTSSSSSGTL